MHPPTLHARTHARTHTTRTHARTHTTRTHALHAHTKYLKQHTHFEDGSSTLSETSIVNCQLRVPICTKKECVDLGLSYINGSCNSNGASSSVNVTLQPPAVTQYATTDDGKSRHCLPTERTWKTEDNCETQSLPSVTHGRNKTRVTQSPHIQI